MQRLMALGLIVFLLVIRLGISKSIRYTNTSRFVFTVSLDSTADSTGEDDDDQYWIVAPRKQISFGVTDEIRSLIGSIILDSGTTRIGEVGEHGYGLKDSAMVRFGTRLEGHTGEFWLDSINVTSLPGTLWVSHIADDTLFKSEILMEYIVFDSGQADTLDILGVSHRLRWNLIGRD